MTKFKCCPMCESEKRIRVTGEDAFNRIKGENHAACINVVCDGCDLMMYDYEREADYDMTYDERVERLAAKWNELPRWQKLCLKLA